MKSLRICSQPRGSGQKHFFDLVAPTTTRLHVGVAPTVEAVTATEEAAFACTPTRGMVERRSSLQEATAATTAFRSGTSHRICVCIRKLVLVIPVENFFPLTHSCTVQALQSKGVSEVATELAIYRNSHAPGRKNS